MTIDSGAMQETKPWTSFAKAADIPDWISQAYIESYRGPHGGEPEAPEVPAASPSVDAAVPAALVTPFTRLAIPAKSDPRCRSSPITAAC